MILIDVRVPHLLGRPDVRVFEICDALRLGVAHRSVHASFASVAVLLDDPTPEHLNSAERRTKTAAAMTRAWSPPYAVGATHVLVLEDDAILAPDAAEAIAAVAERWPSTPVGLFCYRGYTVDAAKAGAVYARHIGFSGGVAQMLPVELAHAFHCWHLAEYASEPWRSVDNRMSHWVQRVGHPVVFPAPSIVDHDTEIESTYAFHGRKVTPIRAALAFGSRSAMSVDWAHGGVWDTTKREVLR